MVEEIEQLPESVFEDEDILVHPVDQFGRNTNRLNASNDVSTIIEIWKNILEHGNKVGTIKFYADRIVFYNNMKDDELKNMTFLTFADHLEAFKKEVGHNVEGNFHEGTSTYQRFHFLIQCGSFFTESRSSPDGFYQYVKRASHIIRAKDHKRIAIPTDCHGEYIDGWQVTIYLEPEPLAQMKQMLMETMGYFYFAPKADYSITIDDQPYPIKIESNWDNIFQHKTKEYCKGDYYASLELGDANATVKIFWLLNNKEIIQYIPGFSQLNDLGVRGTIVLTSIHQFANENRIELNKEVFRDISGIINNIVQQSIKDKETKDAVRVKYPHFKEGYTDFFAKLFQLDRTKIYETLWNDTNQETTLIETTKFIYTLNELFGKTKNYKDMLHTDMFVDPNNRVDCMMDVEDFNATLMKIGSNIGYLRNKFGAIYGGNLIIQGEIEGSFFIGDITRFVNDGKLRVIDASSVKLSQIGNFDNALPLLYPTNENFAYFVLDLDIKDVTSADGYREPPVIFHEVKVLEAFGIRKGEKPTQDPTVPYPESLKGMGLDLFAKILEGILNGTLSEEKVKEFQFDNSGQDYYLGTIKDVSHLYPEPMPFFFLTERDWKSGCDGGIPVHFSYPKYKAMMKAIEVLILNHPAFPDKCIYPVLFSDTRDRIRRLKAWYCKGNGILAINIGWLPESLDMNILANDILLDICHELTHEFVPGHGQRFTQVQQEFLEIAYSHKDKKTNQRIQDLVEKELH